MKKYLAHATSINEFDDFETIEEAQDWLQEQLIDVDGQIHPDAESSRIFICVEEVVIEGPEMDGSYELKFKTFADNKN